MSRGGRRAVHSDHSLDHAQTCVVRDITPTPPRPTQPTIDTTADSTAAPQRSDPRTLHPAETCNPHSPCTRPGRPRPTLARHIRSDWVRYASSLVHHRRVHAPSACVHAPHQRARAPSAPQAERESEGDGPHDVAMRRAHDVKSPFSTSAISAATISLHSSRMAVLGTHPSFSFAFVGSPINSSTYERRRRG